MKTQHNLEFKLENSPCHLAIETSKMGKNLVTTASVMIDTERNVVTHRFFHDFNQRALVTPCARATEKTIKAQHDEVLSKLPELLEKAKAHYVSNGEVTL